MSEPQKPFACTQPDCGMSFTNEDHLNVHTKKHDMVLQLGIEQKAAFVADQTPTPTRFIRNCEEVGLFQDLQNVTVNPFDEGFKRAIETKQGILSLESTIASSPSDDVLHTPQVVFALDDPAMTLLQGHRTGISRSSSDESTIIRSYETALTKLTTEVHTKVAPDSIARVDSLTDKKIDIPKDNIAKSTIEVNNVEIRKDKNEIPIIVTNNIKQTVITKEMVFNDANKLLVPENVPLISQKSIDFVVDSFTNDAKIDNTKTKIRKVADIKRSVGKSVPKILPRKKVKTDHKTNVKTSLGEYEVFIKLPDGKQVRMKPVEDEAKIDTKEVLRNNILKKPSFTHKNIPRVVNNVSKNIPSVLKIQSGTLIPVTLVNHQGTPLSNNDLSKVPITKIDDVTTLTKIDNRGPIVQTFAEFNPNTVRINHPVIKNVNPSCRTNPNNKKIRSPPTPKIVKVRSLAAPSKVKTLKIGTIIDNIENNQKTVPGCAPSLAFNNRDGTQVIIHQEGASTLNSMNPSLVIDNTGEKKVSDHQEVVNTVNPAIVMDNRGVKQVFNHQNNISTVNPVNQTLVIDNRVRKEVFNQQEVVNTVDPVNPTVVIDNRVGKEVFNRQEDINRANAIEVTVEISDDESDGETTDNNGSNCAKRKNLDTRKAASKRYRDRLKATTHAQAVENRLLRATNQKLLAERAKLQALLIRHMRRCPNADDLRTAQEKFHFRTSDT